MATNNMTITYPTVAVTAGPQWASLLNAAFDTIDEHDHTSGKGVPVPTAGLNINADLTLNSKNLFGIRSLRLDNQSATLATASDLRILYSKDGELAYRDAAGNEVVLTAAGSVAGATGTITGLSSPASASFNSITGTYSFLKDTSKPGKFVTSDLLLYEYNNASANSITVKSPASLATSYTVTLPGAVPTQTLPVSMNTSGTLSLGWVDGSVSAPGAAFASDLSTGVYRSAAGVIGFASAGANVASVTAAGVAVAAGSAAAPSLSFLADSNTGIYSSAADTLNLVTGGTSRVALTTTGLTSTVGITGTSGTFSGTVTADTFSSAAVISGPATLGAITGTSIDAGGNASPIKWKYFSGTLTAGASVSLSVSGSVIGVQGFAQEGNSSTWRNIDNSYSTTPYDVYYTTGLTGSITVKNNGGSSNQYRAVVFYI